MQEILYHGVAIGRQSRPAQDDVGTIFALVNGSSERIDAEDCPSARVELSRHSSVSWPAVKDSSLRVVRAGPHAVHRGSH
jgi:hypothetical protein